MSAQVKPIVSKFLREKQLPYQEDSYLSRLRLFFNKYEELMVFAPPITELVAVQWRRNSYGLFGPTSDVATAATLVLKCFSADILKLGQVEQQIFFMNNILTPDDKS